MSEEPKDVRLPFMVTASEAKAIDEWRYANRVPTRAEAMRRLLTFGILADQEIASLRFADVLGGPNIKEDFFKRMIELYQANHPAEDWFDELPE